MLKGHGVFSRASSFSARPAKPRQPAISGCRPPSVNLQVLEKLHERSGNTNVMEVTVSRRNLAEDGCKDEG
jgi:hypothetical protein